MKREYSEKVKQFFQMYTERRRIWFEWITDRKGQGKSIERVARMEALMAQIEDYNTALNALLEHDLPDYVRIRRLFRQMKKCYKELKGIAKPMWRQWFEAIIVAGTIAFFLRTYVFGLYHVPTGSAEPNILVGDRLYGNKLAYSLRSIKRGDLVIFDNPEFSYDRSSALQRWWQKYVGIPFLGLKMGPDNWVKRVIAVPGDTIEGRMENGRTVLYRNGEKLDEVYVNPHPLLTLRKKVGFFDSYGVLGRILPAWLQKNERLVRYTYDVRLPLDQQPYYLMKPEEVVRHPKTGSPLLLPAGTPSYNMFGKNVDVFGPFVVPHGKYWMQGDSRLNSRDSRFWGFLDESLIQGKASFVIFSIDSEEVLWLFSLLKNPWYFFTKQIRWRRFFKRLNTIPDNRLIKKCNKES